MRHSIFKVGEREERLYLHTCCGCNGLGTRCYPKDCVEIDGILASDIGFARGISMNRFTIAVDCHHGCSSQRTGGDLVIQKCLDLSRHVVLQRDLRRADEKIPYPGLSPKSGDRAFFYGQNSCGERDLRVEMRGPVPACHWRRTTTIR